MKMWILRGIIFGIFAAAYVNGQCNPSPCGVNTQCEVSFFLLDYFKSAKVSVSNTFVYFSILKLA